MRADIEIAGFLHETLAAAETTLSYDERAMGVGLLDPGQVAQNWHFFRPDTLSCRNTTGATTRQRIFQQ